MSDTYWALVEPVWNTISIYDGSERFAREFAAAPEVSGTLFAAHWSASEICNGGFLQFFSNSTGVLAPEGVRSFEKIGMVKIAATMREAMNWFGDPYPRERESRLNAFDRADPDSAMPFEALDRRFFELIKTEAGGFKVAADAYAKSWRDANMRS